MRIKKYWIDLLYSLTEDDLKLKITEVNELKKMEVVSFHQYLSTFNDRLDLKISANSKINNRNAKR